MNTLLPSPYLSMNKWLQYSVGFWPHQKGLSKHFFLLSMLFFTISQGYFQVGGMIAAWEETNVFLESIPPVLVDFICAAKAINVLVNSEKMKKLLLILEDDWRRFEGRKEIEIMEKYAILGRKLTLTYTCFLCGSMLPFMLVPLGPIVQDIFMKSSNETSEKQLMFRVDFLFNVDKYYYPLLLHSYFGTIAYILLVLAVDTMVIMYVYHACGSFAILGYQLNHLTDSVNIDVDVYPVKSEDTIYHDMTNCIAQHNHVLEYSKLIEDANYISYFCQLGITMICISFTGFQTVMYLETPDIAARYGGFTITQLLMLLLQSYPGQILYDHSIQISEYAHNCGWYKTSVRTRRLVCLMTMRSRVPSVLTAGRFYILNMANFSAVVRTSMSYLTVLTSVK